MPEQYRGHSVAPAEEAVQLRRAQAATTPPTSLASPPR